MSKESIISKAYDLLKYSIPVLNKFPRDFKFTLGDRRIEFSHVFNIFVPPQNHRLLPL